MDRHGTQKIDEMAEPDNWELRDVPPNQQILYQSFPRFTCISPTGDYPDFGKIHFVIVPYKKMVDYRCLELWLNSFRERSIGHEDAVEEIASTLFQKLELRYIFLLIEFNPRDNLLTYPMTELTVFDSPPEEAKIIKSNLLEKAIKNSTMDSPEI